MRLGGPAGSGWGLALAARGRHAEGALGLGAASDCGDQLFGEEEFVDEVGGAVDLGELAFFVVGARGHGHDLADATEEAKFYGKRVVTSEVVEMEIEKQNVGCVFDGEVQSVIEVSCDADDVSRGFRLQHGGDEAAECGAVVGD